jgi:polysaccharide pyruvyl transferase WcaK-like protein
MARVVSILNENKIKYEPRVVAEVINKHFPDWRRVLNELQRYSVSGTIDAGILVNISETNIKNLMSVMKKKEFTNVRKWVVDNLDNDTSRLFRKLYDNLYDYVDDGSIPHVVVILAEYQYKAAFVADQEINLMACLTEIMGAAKFK